MNLLEWLATVGLHDGFDWDDVGYVAALIVGVSAAVLVLWRAGRAMFACIHQISADTSVIRAAMYPELGPSLPQQVRDLRNQLHPNGGKSLRDQVDGIAARQVRLSSCMESLAKDLEELSVELHRQGARLDTHIDRHGGA